MRIVDNSILRDLDSPIAPVLEKLHEPLVHISPELAEHFNKVFADFTIEYLDDPRPILNVCVSERHIRLSYVLVELIWAAAYAHYIIYQNYFTQCSSAGEVEIDKDPEHKRAMDLLNWAIGKIVNGDGSKWPDELPKPVLEPGFASDEDIADEFCFGACACLIYHELAHIEAQHEGPSRIPIEKEADMASWEWIIPEGVDLTDKQFRKRLLMLVHAFTIPVILDIHHGVFPRKTHPASYERLSHLIEKFAPGENSQAYGFASAAILLHLSNTPSGLAPPPQTVPHDSMKDCFDALIDSLVPYTKED